MALFTGVSGKKKPGDYGHRPVQPRYMEGENGLSIFNGKCFVDGLKIPDDALGLIISPQGLDSC